MYVAKLSKSKCFSPGSEESEHGASASDSADDDDAKDAKRRRHRKRKHDQYPGIANTGDERKQKCYYIVEML